MMGHYPTDDNAVKLVGMILENGYGGDVVAYLLDLKAQWEALHTFLPREELRVIQNVNERFPDQYLFIWSQKEGWVEHGPYPYHMMCMARDAMEWIMEWSDNPSRGWNVRIPQPPEEK